MEPIGLTVGVVGLAGLFSSCLEVIEKVHSYRTFGSDLHVLDAQFMAEKLCFEKWGRAVGLDQMESGDYHHALDDPETATAVREHLAIIQEICRTDDAPPRPSAGSVLAQDGLFPASRTRPYHGAPSGSRRQKLAWALRGSDADRNEAETRQNLHAWLLGRYFPNERYDDSRKKKLPGTCDWVLQRPAFRRWISPDFPAETAKLLWINGPAGFGKTILCAGVTEHLSSTLATPVAHFFFSSDFESRGDPFTAIRSWISQVVSRDPGAFDLVRERCEEQEEQVATRATVVKIFQDILRGVPGCTLVVDGLDECTSMGENRMGAGSESVASFLETVKQAATGTTTRIMIVSRDESEIRHTLMDGTSGECIEYKISHEDVQADTVLYSKSIVDMKLPNKTEIIKSDISRLMSDRCEGQFLWLKLQGDDLEGWMNKKDLLDAIAESPRGLERLYERYWEKIASFRGRKRCRAISLLRWAAFALRPLTICEITEAVLIDVECNDFPIDELPDSIDEEYVNTGILGLCGSLLEVRKPPSEQSPGLRTVHLTHFSVKQYLLCNIPVQEALLLANESLRVSNEAVENTRLAKLCLRYINFRRVWQTALWKHDHFGASFRDYAAALWYHHATSGVSNDSDMIKLANELFDTTNPSWEAWRQWFDSNNEELTKEDAASETRPPGPLYYASRLGLTDTAIYLIKEPKYNADERSSLGRTALGACCENGNMAIARALLDAEVNITIADKQGWTPLNIASSNGHVEMVKLLLEKGADVAVASENGWTPLHVASFHGYVEIVKLLLENGADVAVVNQDGWTPLNSAACYGHVEIVKLLLENGADMAVANRNGWMPLSLAAENGHVEAVRLLLEQGADAESKDYSSQTPLSYAAGNGHEAVAKLLLERGAQLESKDKDYDRTPLSMAAGQGQDTVVKLLLEKGADHESKSNSGRTPLSYAAGNGHEAIVKLLLDNSTDFDSKDNRGETPLSWAVINGHETTAKLLQIALPKEPREHLSL
ncbi:hypothetical protein DL765_008837 [Monosporascus sp. GIB2]|nr:hypothetical protein DL765_008837 [Monosporascus sp. GIB2]